MAIGEKAKGKILRALFNSEKWGEILNVEAIRFDHPLEKE